MFKKCLIIQNSASTNSVRASKYAHELRQVMPNTTFETYKITPGNQNTDKLSKKIAGCESDTLIGVAAGDGTVGHVIETLLSHNNQAPIFPLWGGNANDLATMLNGEAPASIANVLKKASVVDVHPLQCTFTQTDGTTEIRTAMCYVSFGASAYAAKHLNATEHRHNILHRIPGYTPFSETLAAFNGIIQAPRFRVEENGKRYRAYEKLFTNGPRFAKRTIFPLRLTDKKFYMRTVLHKRPFHVFTHLGDMLRNSPLRAAIQQQSVTFTCLSPTLAQLDGEHVNIPAGTQVTLGVHSGHIKALSTLLSSRGATT